MICMKCGTNCADTAKFCLSCGAPLTPTPIPSPTQPYAQQQIPQAPQPFAQQIPPAPQPLQYQAQPMPLPTPSASYYVTPPEKRSKFNIKDPGSILIILACICLCIACFLPYASASGARVVDATVSLTDGRDCIYFITGAIMILIFLFTNVRLGVYITSGIVGILTMLEIFVVQVFFGDSMVKRHVTKEAGYYLLIIATAVLIIGNVILLVHHLKESEKRKIEKRMQMYQQR
ncbi:MAG: hypothetical protein IKX04_05935 [Clostridiales bacterium]|nr:hypothetical protein [Clostridiales bacterium]